VLDKIPDPNLRVYVVWVPILTPQPALELERNAVREAEHRTNDARVLNFADPQAAITRTFAPVLGLASFAGKQVPAWDVYLVYDVNQTWPSGTPPPKPLFWQHQLSHGAPADAKLDGDTFRDSIIAATRSRK
jgi:hypothetical protein